MMTQQHPFEDVVRGFRPMAELVPQTWERGSVMAADGTALHYLRTEGGDSNTPSVVLLHGVQVSGMMWLRTAEALAATCDVIMPDARGHGHTSGLDQTLTADLLADDVLSIIEHLNLNRPFIVGHSMGADTAGHVAARANLRGVVLVDPALQDFSAMMPSNPDELPPYMLGIMQTLAALKTLPHDERMTAGLNLLMPGTPQWHEADYVTFIDGNVQFAPAFYRDFRAFGNLFQRPEVITAITCPILLLTARTMPGANIETGLAAFTHHWRSGQHIHFPESGHALMFDQFERFITVLRNFIGAA